MNVAIFSVLCMLLFPQVASAGGHKDADSVRTRYEQLMVRRMERWQKLIPRHYKMQFAGSIGIVSLGTGWTYGKKDQWETDIMLGFLPKFESEHSKAVLTLKESYVPWRLRIGHSDWLIQPLSCSLYFSSILNRQFWTREPDRYPRGYYGFSTRVRANLSLGQRVVYDIPDAARWRVQDVALYYELGACDIDFCTFFGDRVIKFRDILSLSVGIKLHI